MSNYLTALKTTTRFRVSDSEAILKAIREKAKGYDDCYGWKESMVSADSLKYVADSWGIELYYTDYPEGSCIPIIRHAYDSQFLKDMAEAVALYMDNGIIEGLDDYGRFKVKFKNGTVKFKRWDFAYERADEVPLF